MKNTKLFAFLMVLLMVVPMILTACGGGGGTTTSETPGIQAPTQEQGDPADRYDIDVKDLGGHEFMFLVYDDPAHKHLDCHEVYAAELTGDKINDAVYSRNAQLAQTYNCTVSEERCTKSELIASVKEPLIAGEYVYDFIYTSLISLKSLASSGLLVDFYSLDNIHLEKNWWDHNLAKGITVAGKLFYVNGDAGTLDDRDAQVMFFNRDLIEKNYLEDPFQLAKNGEWTIDKLFELSEACWEDLDGDGVFVVGKDVAAYMCPGQANWTHVVACGGLTLSDVDEKGNIYLPGGIKKEILDVWGELRPLLTSPHRDVSDSGSRFRNGRAAFYIMNLGSILNYGDSAFNFGVLPLPKRNAEQDKYYTTMEGGWLGVYSIPTTVDNMDEGDYKKAGFESGKEFCAYFLNAFGYYSRDTLTPAFYEDVVKRQMIRDETSLEMLELAVENKVYDPVALYSFGNIAFSMFRSVGCLHWSGTNSDYVGAVGDGTNYDTLTSKYAERLEAARKALNNYIKNTTADDTTENA